MAPIFKKLSLLLAFLLCSAFAFVVPAFSKAAPAPGAPVMQGIHASDELPVSVLVSGEVVAGETEGVLQKSDNTLCYFLNNRYLQLVYPQSNKTEAIPRNPLSGSGIKLLHSILTKGP